MLNYIWFALMAIALIFAAVNGTAADVSKAAIDSAKTAVEISIGLVGVMTLWLGIMRIAEAAGLVNLVGRLLSPVRRVLFSEVPKDHPAVGAMTLNIAANMLGLNNAATPFGIKAMEELQTLNPDPETASNAQVMLMVVNTTGVQLVPATVIGILSAAGAVQPTAIISTTLVATFIGTVVAVVSALILQRFFPAPVLALDSGGVSGDADSGTTGSNR
ncbi:MAG TPA: nucleoside recognition domain-containing protein [Thermoanaerobaculia bacterium]|nr:nucleoside recognition domain-containing protein [Thermoanaerobaculia bacterium]